MNEKQTCPDRMRQFGPWEKTQWIDEWRTDRWVIGTEAAAQAREKYKRDNPNTIISETHDEWLWSWGPPRTCSFCGGIHPEDAIRLVSEGWEVEITGKDYKRYLQPPGTKQKHDAVMKGLKTGVPGEEFKNVPSVWSPVPPVKLYTVHFENQEQVDRFNKAVKVYIG